MAYNDRYLLYCKINGFEDPEEMLKVDRQRWPGGVMCGYILWVTGNITAIKKKHDLRSDLAVCCWGKANPGGFEAFVQSAEAVAPELGRLSCPSI